MAPKVVFRETALTDLEGIYDRIAEVAGHDRVYAYVGRIETACRKLETFPERGTVREQTHPGLRIIGFERSASIAFLVHDGIVDILRILPKGMDFPEEWASE